MRRSFASLLLVILLTLPFIISTNSAVVAMGTQTANTLSNHWVPSLNCYRDEINRTDIDYNNCWTDNAGKILTMSAITGDATDTGRALIFLESQGLGSSYYLPETVVNSSISETQSSTGTSVTNGIVQLEENSASTGLDALAIGNYYAGSTMLGYVGSDRILVAGRIYRSTDSVVYPITDGLSKRSLFETSAGDFYLYVNATLGVGEPYANISMQVLPLNLQLTSNDLLYLQVFSSSGQFDNASLYSSNGTFSRALVYNGGSPPAQSGLLIPYSDQYNVFGQDSVAVSFNNSTSNVDDFEHWYKDTAFDNQSWIGIAYYPPVNSVGKMSDPIYTKAYPLEHLDYHLLNDTVKFIDSNPVAVALSPPVGFGFVSYGLALDATSDPQNATLRDLALGYWNYYYSRYNDSSYSTPYARSINLLALAGFRINGCNSTVEDFTRRFLGNTSGSAIEEYGWGAAALYDLKTCTGYQSDANLYNSYIDSFGTSNSHFILLDDAQKRLDLNPQSTFQFGEAASGLLLGGVPYNNQIVIGAMNAVFQSNVSGVVLNEPFNGDLANTETLPAYMLSTWLFQREMRNQTGFWISSLKDANLTSIDYINGTLFIGVQGNNGSVALEGVNSGIRNYQNIDGRSVLVESSIAPTVSAKLVSTTTTTVISSTTIGSTITASYSLHSCSSQCVQVSWVYVEAAVIAILAMFVGFLLIRRRA
ncbi:MAG: hypothetical protein JRN15_16270 [Nitrososphaerota archaeon]|nr:hypothetical protein [Nitrososphaerota archaeon]